jgi:hypothetical protein
VQQISEEEADFTFYMQVLTETQLTGITASKA